LAAGKLPEAVCRLTLVKGRNTMIDFDFSSNAEALVAILLAVVLLAVTLV
jgi:hypothetical protein